MGAELCAIYSGLTLAYVGHGFKKGDIGVWPSALSSIESTAISPHPQGHLLRLLMNDDLVSWSWS